MKDDKQVGISNYIRIRLFPTPCWFQNVFIVHHKRILKLSSQYVTSSWATLALFLPYTKLKSNLNKFIWPKKYTVCITKHRSLEPTSTRRPNLLMASHIECLTKCYSYNLNSIAFLNQHHAQAEWSLLKTYPFCN